MLEVVELKKYFSLKASFFSKTKGAIKALDGVSFSLEKGKILGIVGESGSGKSTLAKVILGLSPPTSGAIYFDGKEVSSKTKGKNISIVFQNPDSSLSPRKRLYDILKEPLIIHKIEDKEKRIDELLSLIGFKREDLKKYPHQFSGGQKQRIAIARALSIKPKLLIADEPVSSLDVSMRGGIINLLFSLVSEFSLSLLFISHDLAVVSYIADDVAVIYLGKIVEKGAGDEIFKNPKHPYTKSLIASIPPCHPRERRFVNISLSEEHSKQGCPFYPRCPEKKGICEIKDPPLTFFSKEHFVLCHNVSP
ncbi:MAG: oligopeptide/dipeptide ABC transporter ATP-binding protein [bacterium]